MLQEESNGYGIKELTNILELPYEMVRKSYKHVFQTMKGDFKSLVDTFCSELKIECFPELEKFFVNKFSSEREKLAPDVVSLIKDLKVKGYKVILFSNSCCLINNGSIKDLLSLVDDVFYSYDLGFTKDDKESYASVLEKLNVKPKEILHIGDTLKSDYFKPLENGWNALYLGKCEDKNVKNITKLSDLYNYLD